MLSHLTRRESFTATPAAWHRYAFGSAARVLHCADGGFTHALPSRSSSSLLSWAASLTTLLSLPDARRCVKN